MRGIHDFIIQIENPFSETIKTESGMEFFADRRFSAERMSNRVGVVVATPLASTSSATEVIKPGFEVLIDPTVLYEQVYHLTGGRQDSVFLADKAKNYYKIRPNMVVLYRENREADWKGYLDNSICEPIPDEASEEPLEHLFIHVPESAKSKHKKGRARLVYGNETLIKDVSAGQELIVTEDMGVSFYIDGKTYLWYRNEDIVAAVNE